MKSLQLFVASCWLLLCLALPEMLMVVFPLLCLFAAAIVAATTVAVATATAAVVLVFLLVFLSVFVLSFPVVFRFPFLLSILTCR